MRKMGNYRATLARLTDWEPFLLAESGLPGPRGNLELAAVVADMGTREQFDRFLSVPHDQAPVNSPHEFLVFCGVVGLGRLLAEGDHSLLPRIRRYASDFRWRTREAVAMALQRWGRTDMAALLDEMQHWAVGNRLEQRAAAAAVAEPALLKKPSEAIRALSLLDTITRTLPGAPDRRTEDFKTLRQGLGYCWSVVVAAVPESGEVAMERWFAADNPDVRWVMKENLKKKRLAQMDADWVTYWRDRLKT
ncbi:MAG TPA: hypothetical protein PLE60_12670 [Candidatus Latescibacteria bacterium]|nr:hypothetical protein [Candidatus Latescibacterota bacterium]